MTGDRCSYMTCPDVQCPLPSTERGYCDIHKHQRCGNCGAQATRTCDVPVEENTGCSDKLCDSTSCRLKHAICHLDCADWPDRLRPKINAYIEELE